MTPTAATPTTTTILKRWTVSRLPNDVSPYEGIDVDGDGDRDEWRSNWRTVYVQRNDPHLVSLKPKHGYVKLLNADELATVRRIAKLREWKLDVTPRDLTIVKDAYPNLGGDLDCEAELLHVLQTTAAALSKEIGRRVEIWVRSGGRTMNEQWALYNENMSGGVPKPGRPLTAYPNENAPHVQLRAADCGINGENLGTWRGGIARAHLDRAGGCLNVASEAWHVQRKAHGNTWASNWRP